MTLLLNCCQASAPVVFAYAQPTPADYVQTASNSSSCMTLSMRGLLRLLKFTDSEMIEDGSIEEGGRAIATVGCCDCFDVCDVGQGSSGVTCELDSGLLLQWLSD